MCRIKDNLDVVDNVVQSFRLKKRLREDVLDLDEIRASALYGLLIADRKWTSEKEKGCAFRTFAQNRAYWQVLEDYRDRLLGGRNCENRPFQISLDVPVQDNESTEMGYTFKDMLKADTDTEAEVVLELEKPTVRSELERLLTTRELIVVGLTFWHDLSQTEIADISGVTGGRISQLLSNALRKLRRSQELYNLHKELRKYEH